VMCRGGVEGFRGAVWRRGGVPERSTGVSRQDFVAWLLSPNADPAAQSAWCDGPCDRMLSKALESAAAELAARLGPDPAAWRWGVVHRAVFDHPVLRFVTLVGRVTVVRPAIPVDTTTI